MLRILNPFILLLSFLVMLPSFAADITEQDVKNLIAKTDKATSELDVVGIADALADDVEIVMNINISGNYQVLKPNKAEYLAMLKEGWSVYSNYQYERLEEHIEIKDNKAYLTTKVKETMTIEGKTSSAVSREEAIIELVDGEPLITKVVGYISM